MCVEIRQTKTRYYRFFAGSINMESVVASLKDQSIDYLCNNWTVLWTVSQGDQNKLEWRDPDLVLFSELSEKLLYRLSEKGKLDDKIMLMFHAEHTSLKHAVIPNASRITKKGLRILGSHRLLSLDIRHSSVTLAHVLRSLGSGNWMSLRRLEVLGEPQQMVPGPIPKLIADSDVIKLINVHVLSLVDVRLSNESLKLISSNLRHLQHLDISENAIISDISPLQALKHQLKALIMRNVIYLTEEHTAKTLHKLDNLQHLDVSLPVFPRFIFELQCPSVVQYTGLFHTNSLLRDPSSNPNMMSLYLSGREPTPEEMFRRYVEAHPSLRFLGLWGNRACEYPMFDVRSPEHIPGIEVSGHITLEQFAVSLKHYQSRDCVQDMLLTLCSGFFEAKGVTMTSNNDSIIRALTDVLHTRGLVEGDNLGEVENCLFCLQRLLKDNHVSYIQLDTVKRLFFICRSLLKRQVQPDLKLYMMTIHAFATEIMEFCEAECLASGIMDLMMG